MKLIAKINLVLSTAILALTILGALQGADDPDAHHRTTLPKVKNSTSPDGEQFAWICAYHADDYWKGYLVSKDERWIKNAIELYDVFLSKNSKDPDGYWGTIGGGFDNQKTEDFQYRWDTVVGDSIQCLPLLKLAEIILKDNDLKQKYGDKANYYVEYAEKMCWEKWNKRGCAYEDAAGFVSYRTYEKQIDPKTNKWVDTPNKVISDNLNKHYDMATVMLRLYRITGKKEYKERAYKVFARAKHMFRLFPDEDRIVWNFWMPHGPYDLEGTSPKSWVGVHSSRSGYQSGEVNKFIEAYDTGVVFDKNDLERMIKTNLWMLSQGFKKSADGTSSAGQLWAGFGRFNETLFAEATKGGKESTGVEYLKQQKELGWKRAFVSKDSEIQVYDFKVEAGKNIALAVVIPNTLETINEDRVKILAQLRANTTYSVDILDKNGKLLGQIHTEEYKVSGGGYNTILWDGTNPKTGKIELGEYMVRFTLGSEVRTWPVVLIKGTKKEKEKTYEMAKGETLNVDFESALKSSIWSLESGAQVVDGKGIDGSKALEIGPGHSAKLRFGEFENLKVKITMSVYDDGVKLGKVTAGGGFWGCIQADGNIFAIHRYWRKYLSGDDLYTWLNNGENQWFSAHPSNLTRKAGWRTFEFDFSGSGMATVTCDGQKLDENKMNGGKYVPEGVIGVAFGGPGHNMKPIYIDNIKVTYP